MSHQNRINKQRLFIQRAFLISLLSAVVTFRTAMPAVGQTEPLAANFTYSSSLVGAAAYNVAGWDVAFLGDVNQDGFGDLLIGASENNQEDLPTGAAYLIFGSATMPPLSTSLTTADVTFVGEKSMDECRMKVAGPGDINGDGFSDFVIAAPMEDNGTGKIYLVFGKASGWQAETKLSQADVIFSGENWGDNAGITVASAGDVNSDGMSDLIIGAPRCDRKGNDIGKAYLIFGKKSEWVKDFSLANADVIFEGETMLDMFGTSVAGVGDVNKDGIDDIAIGAPFHDGDGKKDIGKVYIFFGKGSFSTKIDVPIADASFIGKHADDLLGKFISNGGDVNGDGVADFSVTASLANDAGKIYLILGKASGWLQNDVLEDFAPSFIAENPGDFAGVPTFITNLNKDGFFDLLIGASKNSQSGKVYLIEGKPTGWSHNISLANADIFMLGKKPQDYAGHALAAGDFDGDGYQDVAVGAPGSDVAGDDAGIVCLFHSPFKPLPASLTLTAPNGGESWLVGSEQLISWTAEGDIEKVTLKYSTDNGFNWKIIIENTLNDGEYAWTVPNDPSTTCLVSVEDATDGDPLDTSEQVFAIAAPVVKKIKLIAPNGGECWLAETEQEIKWTSQDPVHNVSLEYSIDGGQNWGNIIEATPDDGSHHWIVPPAHSLDCLVKIADAANDIPEDTSDAAFTIWGKAPITILTPNGDEYLKPGQQFKIKWEACPCIDSVKIQYSIDGGEDWNVIVKSTPNDSCYTWTVPEVHSTNCLVKVADLDCDPQDVSDKPFTIWNKALITVISPNGGECLQAGQEFEIQWEASCSLDSMKIQYSINGGKEWKTIVYGTDNDGKYLWTVPKVHSDSCLIKVADLDCDPHDVSDSLFTIWGKAPVTVIYPNGGECLKPKQKIKIKWEACCCLDSLKIQYSTDGGNDWTSIVYGSENDGSFLWTVPDVHSNNCLIKVADLDCDPQDVSNKPFTIWGKAPITVISPNGGECLKPGQKIKIKWEAICCLDSLKIQFSSDAGKEWSTIVYGTPNDSSYWWTVPKVHSTQCLIKVADLDCDPKDVSNKTFTIWNKAPITVISPNGGECLVAGKKFKIKWAASCCFDSLKIKYSVDGGEDWNTIIYGTPNDSCYSWTVPAVNSKNCLIKVADLDCDPQDVSDKPFTICTPPYVAVLQPNGGENLQVGTQYQVKWHAGCFIDTVKIQYSTDNGKNWQNIVAQTENDSLFIWTVPNTPSDSCLIKVADVDCNPYDVSDKAFSITPLPVWQVIKPNGGEILTAGTDFEIKWTSSGYQVDSVKIQYSVDGGKNWLAIIYRTTNDGSYIWKIPNTPNDSCLVKVADVDCDPSDVSDGFFTIKTVAVVNFDATIMTGCAPLEVKFSNLSTDNAVRWRWSFGDGKFSDEKEPVYTYSLPGFYTVKLAAYYQSQIDSVTKVDFIRVHQPETFARLNVASASPTLPKQDCSKATDGDLYGWDGTVVLDGEQPNIIFSLNNTANKEVNSVGLITDTGIGFEDRWIHRFQVQISTAGSEAADFQTVLDTTMTTGGFEVFAIQPVPAKFIKLVVLSPQKGLVQLGEFEAYFTDGEPTAVVDQITNTPTKFSLAQNYPNPFNPTTTIRFELPKSSRVRLEIYNVLGEKIRTLFNGNKQAGIYELTWDGKNKDGVTMPSGVYLYILSTNEHREVKKMILAK